MSGGATGVRGAAARHGAPVPPAFVHDLNTCVGCHACAIACVNENQLAPGEFWRQVVSFNPERRPWLPTFHLSLACNHCLDAPCLRYCPALAIARDPSTGAVLIDENSCIGCRYCSWVCPYDAPRFDERRGVMQKCTLCAHRLREGLQPACASLCPTGALRVGQYADGPDPEVAGFPRFGIRPAIRFIPLKGRGPIEPADAGEVTAAEAAWQELEGDVVAAHRKISLGSEWALATFTLVAIALVAWMWGRALGGPAPHAGLVAGAGVGAVMLSTLHLGRKARAWRAMLNWRRSWLSCEVIAYPLFLALTLASLVLMPGHTGPMVAAALAGAVCLTCVDRVYVVMARQGRSRFDNVTAITSAAFLAGIVAAVPSVFVPTGAVRLAVTTSRVARRTVSGRRWSHPLVVGRIGLGLALPLALWMLAGAGAWPWVAGLAFVGEALDRLHFYDTLDVVTPGVRS